MHRVLRIAGSFVITLVAYWAYALVAVPLIEPPADLHVDQPIPEDELKAAKGRMDVESAKLKRFFPAGAWELQGAKILESKQFMLVMQDYRNLGDGRVEIHPCSMVFTPDGPVADATQQNRQAMILEAPEGALLEFDGPFDLRRMKIGRLVGGRLMGPVRIRGKGKSPGPEDNLLIETRNVELTEKNIITPHTVDFRWGPHSGRGGQMRIKLLSGGNLRDGKRGGPNIAGIELFELRRLDRLHLELGELNLASEQEARTAGKQAEGDASGGASVVAEGGSGRRAPPGDLPAGGVSDLPVEVTCKGPFRFDVIKKVATFEDRVDVLRINPTGPSDQLDCELLSIFFTDSADPAASRSKGSGKRGKKQPAGSLKLRPERIEARGDPVVVHAPSEGVHARGQRLEYELKTGRIVLDGSHPVMLQQDTNEIHARSLQYQPADTGELGRVVAKGPGWLRGRMDERPDQQLEARWTELLRVRPDGQNQVISFSGDAGLKFRGIGQLEAEEIHFWLLESKPPSPQEKSRLRPDRMLARRAVRMQSRELSGTVGQLEVWFEPSTMGGRDDDLRPTAEIIRKPAVPAQAPFGGRPQGPRPAATSPFPAPLGGLRNTDSPPATAPVQAPSGGSRHGDLPPAAQTTGEPTSGSATRQQHFRISGRLLRARMLLQEDGHTELSELTVEDGVQFVETQTKQPDERPLLIRGDRLHVVDAEKPYAAMTVTGRPAHFQGRGLGLTGPNINLNRGTNRLWIDAPGRMDLPIDRDLEGRRLANAGRMRIHWQDGMVFDGRTARFEDSVTVTAPRRHLQTETLEVQFKTAIDFSDDKIEQDPKVQRLLCRGGVFMESLSFDAKAGQTQTSHEQMQVTDLAVDLDSGALTAGGPGWVTSVGRGSDDPLAARNAPGPPRPAKTLEQAAGGSDDQLRGLHVRFQGSITGNVIEGRREMTFRDRVRAAYAPVDSWEAKLEVNDPDALGPGGVVMHCDRLSVNQMAGPQAKGGTLEFVAQGNTVVEGSRFTARAIRMAYAEAKGLLILEGDGRTDARLFRQQRVGDPSSEFAARKIFYWPKTGGMKLEGARSLKLDRPASGDPGGH